MTCLLYCLATSIIYVQMQCIMYEIALIVVISKQVTILQLLLICCPPHRPSTLLLVQGTTGGMNLLAVAQTMGCVDCGIMRIQGNGYKPVLVYQLDLIKRSLLIGKFKNKTLRLDQDNSYSSILIYIV